jgi:hypothetical protein
MAIGAALVDESDYARRGLRGYCFGTNKNQDNRKRKSGHVSRHGQSIRPREGLCLLAVVLVGASIDEIADQAKQRERDHNDDADDKRQIQAVRTDPAREGTSGSLLCGRYVAGQAL